MPNAQNHYDDTIFTPYTLNQDMNSNAMKQIADPGNIHRAWRWIRSNPDSQYKSYFRDIYSAWSTASDDLLVDVGDRLERGIYEPSQACKLYHPKPSGVLRPYTLLSVRDQIVYQATVNIVAERLQPRVRHRYYKEVFGHLYAGKSSVWFYRKWSDGYTRFNEEARKAFRDGYRYAATFDITACYDSIAHSVLCHFLRRLNLDDEFCNFLVRCLAKWTATDSGIIHGHGIPQGPISSGMLSEVVLQYFDANRGRETTVRYLRYVDDIRLYAATEEALRQSLVRLDRLSKDIGLFPQSSKINIQEVVSIEKELKSISHPPEQSISRKAVDQRALRARIVALSPYFKPTNPTRFKYLLAHAIPNAKLTERLWRIYEKEPAYYLNIARYYSRYTALPRRAAEQILNRIRLEKLYPAITTAFILAIRGRLNDTQLASAMSTLRGFWKPSGHEADLFAATARALIPEGIPTFDQLQYACVKTRSWWARAQIALALTSRFIGEPSLARLLTKLLGDGVEDVAIIAASRFSKFTVLPNLDLSKISPVALAVLHSFGIGLEVDSPVCGIHLSLTSIVGELPEVDWQGLLCQDYKQAERQTVWCRAYAETNATAFVNAMDVWNDLLLCALYRQRPSLGTYTAVGSIMNSSRLKKSFPGVQALIQNIHQHRYESLLSHAQQRRTGKPTGHIKYTYIRMARRLIRSAVRELAREFPLER